MALYGGPFLYENSYDEWAEPHRVALQDLRLGVLGWLSSAYAAQADWEQAAACCREILAADPYREDAVRQLLHCLAATGRLAEVERTYRACRERIWHDLQVEPAPETIHLYPATRHRAERGPPARGRHGARPVRWSASELQRRHPLGRAANLVACVRSVLEHEPELPPDRIVVVDDGARRDADSQLPAVSWISGEKPFIFGRNANLGIRAADGDVILLNDDTRLETRGGFTKLAEQALALRRSASSQRGSGDGGEPAPAPAAARRRCGRG